MLDACSQLTPKREAPDTGSLRGDLILLARDLANRLRTARWPSVLPSIIDAAERDSGLANVHARLHREMMNGFRSAIEQARARGEITSSQDTSHLLAALVGPLFYRRWFSREPLDDRFAKSVVESALGKPKE